MNAEKKLQALLRTLFQFDCADLDFGIYRILNYKRKEIEEFISTRIPQVVGEAFASYAAADRETVQHELERLRQEIRGALGADALDATGELKSEFRETPLGSQYLEALRKAETVEVAEDTKASVYNDLYVFFSRYYADGDFVTKRRYGRKETYAIPYNGEDIVLHWANRDQYYIKTGEWFKTYRVKLGDCTVSFELRNTSVRQDDGGSDRRYFVLAEENQVDCRPDAQALTIYFEYRSLTEEEKAKYGKTEQQRPQETLNAAAEKAILDLVDDAALKARLGWAEETSEQTALGKELARFTRRNAVDFFIHKDLKGFLQRELEFFIKNEVLLLDELIGESEPDVQRHVQRARVLHDIAERIVDFLAQVEEFQRRLFEKKKFVARTEYCLTVDRVPSALWGEVLQNATQIAEWQRLFGLDKLVESQELAGVGLNEDVLRNNPTLVVDTSYFPDDFKSRLVASFDNLDHAIDGVLIKSENWQALNLLMEKYGRQVKCIYIDPPFNTGTNEFLYRNDYLNSTWLCMLSDRIARGREFLDPRGNIFVRIDYHGDFYVRQLLDSTFGEDNRQNHIIIKRGRETAGSRGRLETATETLFWFSRGPDPDFHEIAIPRPIAQVSWTGFLMGGERHPRERTFLGKTLVPPNGQHYPLQQSKVDQLMDEYFLRLRCRGCGALYFKAQDDHKLQTEMKKSANRYKFYDVTAGKVIHGVQTIEVCLECGSDEWAVDYLGAPTVNASNLWTDIESYAKRWGFFTENSEPLLHRVLELASLEGERILDFFLGAGTTTAVAQKMRRKWIGVEMGEHFETVALPRMKQVLFGEQSGISKQVKWKGGGFFKYHMLEQYEDTLNNLELPRAQEGQTALEMFGEEYLLRYMLEFETQGSSCLLNLDAMKDPLAYRLKVQEGDEIVERVVDLVETFNYLLGIDVKRILPLAENGRAYRAVLGEKDGKHVVIVWRPVGELDDDEEALLSDKRFIEQTVLPSILPVGVQPDRLLVNEPSFVEGAEAIEPEFKRLMFSGVL